MENVLLINPSQTYYGRTYRQSACGSIGLPLGLLYVAAAFEKKGCSVRVIDCLVSEHSVRIKGRDSVRFGIPAEKLGALIEETKPDIVGIGSQYTAQEEGALEVARVAKSVAPTALVIVGGANAACRAANLLREGTVDVAVKSEGERTAEDLVVFLRGQKELARIPGIAYRRNGSVFETEPGGFIEDLDGLPLPAYHLIDMEAYLTLYEKGVYTRDRDVVRNASMITSRGCPYGCVFCSISLSMGKSWRAHSAAYVIRHIRELSKKYGVRHIHFEDDNLLFDPARFDPVIDVLAEENISWDTPNGIRVDLSLDERFLARARRSGCKSLTIGVESGDERVLKQIIRKGTNLARVEEFAGRCRTVGLPLRAFFVLGFPGETLETMKRTMDFALRLQEAYRVEILNFIATPLFGTDLYDICERNRYLSRPVTPQTLSESTVSDGIGLISTEAFSSRDVERLSRWLTAKVYRRYLRRGIAHPWKSLRRIGNVYTFKRTLARILH